MIVIDNSALIGLLVGSGSQARTIEARIDRADRVCVPELVDLEATSALRRLVRVGEVSDLDAEAALRSLMALPLERWSHLPLVPRIWELRDNLTPYDAAYVALAESLDVSLLTADARLMRSPGIRCAVELIS